MTDNKLLETYLDNLLTFQALYTASVFRLPRDPNNEAKLLTQIKEQKALICHRFSRNDKA
jgi:hypothetical protein